MKTNIEAIKKCFFAMRFAKATSTKQIMIRFHPGAVKIDDELIKTDQSWGVLSLADKTL
jgi:hypothetical protein